MTELLDGDKWFNKAEVPEQTNGKLSRGHLDYLVATSQIPYIRLGKRKVVFSKKQLQSWIKEQTQKEVRYNK